MTTRKDRVMTFRVEPALEDSIEEYARDRREPLSHAIVQLIERGLWTVTKPKGKGTK